MTEKRTIEYTVRNNLCTGCGVCEDVCPAGSITIEERGGLLVPGVNMATCISHKGCRQCLKVCAGYSIDLKNKQNTLFASGTEKTDKFMDRFLACYSGYSCDREIRFHSASGGSLGQFLVYLLSQGYMQGAAVTGFNPLQITTPRAYVATTAEEILQARSSKYCPVSMNRVGNDLCKKKGKYVIVGLPCHIQSFRKREVIDAGFRDKVLGYFSLYCSSTRSFFATEYLFKHYKINHRNLRYFAYRDDGCLGSLKAVENDGTVKTVPYLDYYSLLRSFFIPRRCLSCTDHYGMLADVSFGDIYTGKYKEDTLGVNSIIVRNHTFHRWLQQASRDGAMAIEEIPPEIINQSQEKMLYGRKRKVCARQTLNRLSGRSIVEYDQDLKHIITFNDIVRFFITNIQLFIGKRRYLWFLIRVLKRK